MKQGKHRTTTKQSPTTHILKGLFLQVVAPFTRKKADFLTTYKPTEKPGI